MEKQKKNDSGITLVALVVSIIVMLVLAGVSLNATVGENGIVTRAQEATLKQKVAEELENLNLELAKLNIDTISTDEIIAIQDIASYLVGKGTIDSFVTTSAGQIAAGIDTATRSQYFFGVKGDNTYRITRENDGLLTAELTTYSSGGDITGGYALITADSFNNDDSLSAEEKGKFTITSDAEVVFMDTISGALSIYVKSGVHATVGIYADMTLTNQNISRSAIHIEEGGILDMYIGEGVNVTVNSGLGATAPVNRGSGAEGGNGGYAGIHVTWTDTNENGIFDLKNNNSSDYDSYGTLNLYGNGTIIAIGGNAGDGGTAVSNNAGGGGGGGAGAGIGGNGGKGGNSNSVSALTTSTKVLGQSGTDGLDGENCGLINVHGTVCIYAYGGKGGSGGLYTSQTGSSGTGGSGYPAAGIGGGGAGGGGADHMNGGGGYSSGVAESCTNDTRVLNGGVYNKIPSSLSSQCSGGSYFANHQYDNREGLSATVGVSGAICNGGKIGGQGGNHINRSAYNCDSGGDGGVAGKGGIVCVNYTSADNRSYVYSFNGDMISEENFDYDSTKVKVYNYDGSQSESLEYIPITYHYKTQKFIQTPIFAQEGILRDVYKINAWWTVKDKYNSEYFNKLLGATANTTVISTISEATQASEVSNYLVRAKQNIAKTGYINPITNDSYGIGSGAGYIELSNGSYTRYNEDASGNFTTVYTEP